MYKHFYQLASNPFRLAPEPNFCFGHTGYRRAREYLEFALNQGEGFVMVTGRPGTGKTMLVETFLKETDISRAVARRIAVANYGAEDLLRAIAYAYGIDAEGLDKGTMRHRIQQYFIEQERSGRRVLLIIDEAQALRHAALEELRILADLQTQSRLMLQLFLVGQESLQDLMRTPDMEQFQQRVIANYQLVPLNLLDTRNYIEHRLLQAGWSGDPEITSAAVVAIYQLSKGVPRHINKICNRLLLLGYSNGSHVFNEANVRQISVEMQKERLTPLVINESTQLDAENVTDISEIRDDLVSGTDLAIRVDKVDAKAAGSTGHAKLAAHHHKAVEMRHSDDQCDSMLPESPVELSSVTAQENSSTVEPVQVFCEPDFARHRAHRQADVPPTDRSGWKMAAIIVVGILASATILLAAMPSILDKLDTDALIAMLTPATRDDQIRPSEHSVTLAESDRREQKLEVVTEESDSASAAVTASGSIARETDAGGARPAPIAKPAVTVASDEIDVAPAAYTDVQQPASDAVASPGEVDDSNDYVLSESSPIMEQSAARYTDRHAATVAVSVYSDDDLQVLLANGQQALDEYRLMTPDQDNAYYYLRAARKIDPDNEIARAGIQQIVDLYIILAGKEVDKGEFARAGRYLARGLEIQPDNAAMLALQQRVSDQFVEVEADAVPMVGTTMAPSLVDRSIQLKQKSLPLKNTPALMRRQPAARRRQVSYTVE